MTDGQVVSIEAVPNLMELALSRQVSVAIVNGLDERWTPRMVELGIRTAAYVTPAELPIMSFPDGFTREVAIWLTKSTLAVWSADHRSSEVDPASSGQVSVVNIALTNLWPDYLMDHGLSENEYVRSIPDDIRHKALAILCGYKPREFYSSYALSRTAATAIINWLTDGAPGGDIINIQKGPRGAAMYAIRVAHLMDGLTAGRRKYVRSSTDAPADPGRNISRDNARAAKRREAAAAKPGNKRSKPRSNLDHALEAARTRYR